MAKVFTRICIKDWEITAQNGDYFKAIKGAKYTTSDDMEGGNCMVFSNFWISVPIKNFGDKLPL